MKRPADYDTLVFVCPSATEVVAATVFAVAIICSPLLFVHVIVGLDSSSKAFLGTTLLLVALTGSSLLINRHRLGFMVFGEFRFRKWQIAKTARVRQVHTVTIGNYSDLRAKVDRLTRLPIFGCYVAEIEVSPSWGNGPTYPSYARVDQTFAEAFYPGMTVSVRFQVSRLHQSRLRIASAL